MTLLRNVCIIKLRASGSPNSTGWVPASYRCRSVNRSWAPSLSRRDLQKAAVCTQSVCFEVITQKCLTGTEECSKIIPYSFISIQPWRSGLAGTRAQSCDRYGSGTLHPGQVLGGSLPLLSPMPYMTVEMRAKIRTTYLPYTSRERCHYAKLPGVLRHIRFLGTFLKLRKAIISFMSVCPSARNNSASTGRIFMKFDIWVFFENLSRIFKFH